MTKKLSKIQCETFARMRLKTWYSAHELEVRIATLNALYHRKLLYRTVLSGAGVPELHRSCFVFRKKLPLPQQKALDGMFAGIWYSAYDLDVHIATLNTLYHKGLVDRRSSPNLFTPYCGGV